VIIQLQIVLAPNPEGMLVVVSAFARPSFSLRNRRFILHSGLAACLIRALKKHLVRGVEKKAKRTNDKVYAGGAI